MTEQKNQNLSQTKKPSEKEIFEQVLREKTLDADIPGFMVECSPEEAEALGAFEEDALSEVDALESACDLEDSAEV